MLSFSSIELYNLGSYKSSIHYFKNDGLKIIVGLNRDTMPLQYKDLNFKDLLNKEDLNLPSNGSGKSLISEGINLALFGEPIRKNITVRDLIRKGEDSCKIVLKCYNNLLKIKEIKIVRTFFTSKYKSSILEVYEDGEEIKKSSVELLTKYILEQYIGITKENIINYFIIQNSRYTPFLHLSDSKKKEIIAEFTGINTLDLTKEKIQQNINTLKLDIFEKEKEASNLNGKIEAFESLLNNTISEENFETKVKEEQEELIGKVKKIDIKISENNNYFSQLEKSQSYNDNLIKYWEEKQKRIKKIVFKVQEGCLKKNAKNQELKQNVEEALNNISSILSDKNKDKGTIEANLAKYKVFLKNVIVCPKCHFSFNPAQNKSEEELKLEIEKLKKDCSLTEQNIKELLLDKNDLLDMLKETTDKEIEIKKRYNRALHIQGLASEIQNKYKEISNNLKQKKKRLLEEDEALQKQKKYYLELKEAKKNSNYKDILEQKEKYNKNIAQLNKQIKEKEKEIDNTQKKVQIQEDSLITLQSFKNYLFDFVITNIQNICNYYLSQFCNNLFIKLSNSKTLADGKTKRDEITCLIEKDNYVNNFGILSNGEKVNVNIAFILTFQHIINTSSQNGLNYILLDEITGSLDSYNQNKVFESLNKINKCIEIITHTSTIGDFDITYINKKNNTSEIIENY